MPSTSGSGARGAAAFAHLADNVAAADRRSLAQAVTLVESKRPEDRLAAVRLLEQLRSTGRRSLRIGISGAPGVGKSTLIEALGKLLLEKGLRPAVLAIDPSSDRTGGSLLGDKTRMQELSVSSRAYVRPSPSGSRGGGISVTTADTLLVCEAAGFDPCIVETVGVGQGETAIVSVVDLLVVLLEPGAGDELQGLKRGLLEWADLVVVNKADEERVHRARSTKQQYGAALNLLRRSEQPTQILLVSAKTGEGVSDLWATIDSLAQSLKDTGELKRRRRRQLRSQFQDSLRRALLERLVLGVEAGVSLDSLESQVMTETLSVHEAVAQLLEVKR